ncbi:MAG: GNAT family N-acetyltransferase [Pseudomonadota bacterium]
MRDSDLKIELLQSSALSTDQHDQLVGMCTTAYGEDIAPAFRDVGAGSHVLGRLNDEIVSHAMWVNRQLQVGGELMLITAYVELVATSPKYQGRGFATQVMQRLQRHVHEYELAALSPADTTLYERLGWEYWRGDLHIRTNGALESTPDESVMILRLPRTPEGLNTSDSLSAEWRPGEVW